MKSFKALTCFLICFMQISYAQVTTLLSGIDGLDIVISGDDLYYLDNSLYEVFKADISDPDLPVVSFVFDTDEPSLINGGVLAFGINGTDLYFATVSGAGLPEFGKLYKKDLSNLALASVEVNTGFASAITDIDFYGAWMHVGDINNDGMFKRYNIAGAFPVGAPTYMSRDVTALQVNGGSLYFSESFDSADGEIFFKNMVLDLPEVSKFTAVGVIHDLYFFEGLLYFTDDEGLKRINPIDPIPTSELLVTNADYGDLRKIQIKDYVSGDKYLFVTEIIGDRILRVDLNDPALSIKKTKLHSNLHIYPNPMTDILYIDSQQDIIGLKMFDVLGKEIVAIKDSSMLSNKQINISNIESGMYVVKVFTLEGAVTKKIIKK